MSDAKEWPKLGCQLRLRGSSMRKGASEEYGVMGQYDPGRGAQEGTTLRTYVVCAGWKPLNNRHRVSMRSSVPSATAGPPAIERNYFALFEK